MKTKYLNYLAIALLILVVAVAAVGDTNVTNLVASGDISAGDDLSITDDAAVGGDFALTGQAYYQDALQVLTDNGAITVQSGVVLLNKGSAIAATIVAPTTAQNGMIVRIYSMTAQAHTVTATTIGFNALNAAGDVCTLGGAISDGLTIVASAGEWWLMNNVNCTLG